VDSNGVIQSTNCKIAGNDAADLTKTECGSKPPSECQWMDNMGKFFKPLCSDRESKECEAPGAEDSAVLLRVSEGDQDTGLLHNVHYIKIKSALTHYN
jgi:hypothetical protein